MVESFLVNTRDVGTATGEMDSKVLLAILVIVLLEKECRSHGDFTFAMRENGDTRMRNCLICTSILKLPAPYRHGSSLEKMNREVFHVKWWCIRKR